MRMIRKCRRVSDLRQSRLASLRRTSLPADAMRIKLAHRNLESNGAASARTCPGWEERPIRNREAISYYNRRVAEHGFLADDAGLL